MTIPRIYISAAHKSSGKTTLSLGICAALTRQGHRIQPLKKGPDYIDPLWLGAASAATCYNLDFNTMSHEEIQQLMTAKCIGKDMAVIEGNKGLYDGVELDGSNSNAAMAKLIDAPVILVLDAQGMTRGVAPLLLGYQAFDKDITIAGVIFNKIGGVRHERKLLEITQYYTDIPVLGAVEKSNDMFLVERHLGLMPYNETKKAKAHVAKIADRVQEQVDLQRLLKISRLVTDQQDYNFPAPRAKPEKEPELPAISAIESTIRSTVSVKQPVTIGICRDAAFGFYYTDDLEALEQQGAKLVNINTLHDKSLPEIDALFIGGGFPETHMQALSANESMLCSIHDAIESGMPVYAECGGLMYLSESISWQEKSFPMVGVVPAQTMMHEKPQGRGYVVLREESAMPWPRNTSATLIPAHEFHYSTLTDKQGKLTQKGSFAYAVERGVGIDGKHDGWLYKNLLASYSHLRDTRKNHWAERFVRYIQHHKFDRNKGQESKVMITVTKSAQQQIDKSRGETDISNMPLRIAIKVQQDGSFHYQMGFDDKQETGDTFIKEVNIVVDEASKELAKDMSLDFVEIEDKMEFIFINPNDPTYKPSVTEPSA